MGVTEDEEGSRERDSSPSSDLKPDTEPNLPCTLCSGPESPVPHCSKSLVISESADNKGTPENDLQPTQQQRSLFLEVNEEEIGIEPESGSSPPLQSLVEEVEPERKRSFLSSLSSGIRGKSIAKVFTGGGAKTNPGGGGGGDRMNNSNIKTCPVAGGSSARRSTSESNIPLCHNLLESLEGRAGSPPPPPPTLIRRSSFGDRDALDFLEPIVTGRRRDEDPTNPEPSSSSSYNVNTATVPDGVFDGTSLSESYPSLFLGPKFKFVTSGDVQVSKLKHGQNLLGKLTSSKLLRRWETHHLYLNDMCISSKTVRLLQILRFEQVYLLYKLYGHLKFEVCTK
jgi:hypothetical protein